MFIKTIIQISKTNIIGEQEMVYIRTIKKTLPLGTCGMWLLASKTTPENLGCVKKDNLMWSAEKSTPRRQNTGRKDIIPDTAYREMVKKIRTREPRQTSAGLQGRDRYKHAQTCQQPFKQRKGWRPPTPCRWKERRATQSHRPAATELQGVAAFPLGPTSPNPHSAGCPQGRHSNEFVTGCWQGALTPGIQ